MLRTDSLLASGFDPIRFRLGYQLDRMWIFTRYDWIRLVRGIKIDVDPFPSNGHDHSESYSDGQIPSPLTAINPVALLFAFLGNPSKHPLSFFGSSIACGAAQRSTTLPFGQAKGSKALAFLPPRGWNPLPTQNPNAQPM